MQQTILFRLLVVGVASFQWVAGQEHFIGFAVGYDRYLNRDALISPMIYRGRCLGGELRYMYERDHNRHEFQTCFSFGMLQTQTSIPMDYNRLEAEYIYLRKLRSHAEQRFVIRGGLVWTFAGNYRIRKISDYTGRELETRLWEVLTSLQAALEVSYTFKSDLRLALEAHMGVLSYVHRPGYAFSPTYSPEVHPEPSMFDLFMGAHLLGPAGYSEVDIRLSVQRHLSRTLLLSGSYRLLYYRCVVPVTVSAVSERFSLGLGLVLGK